MALITYENKVALNENPNIADINKVKADDMNEIKSVVNGMIVNTRNTGTTNTYSCDYINDCNTYSTSETFTGKYWIDGKPIYRKTVETTDTNATTNWKNYDWSTLGIPNTADRVFFPEVYAYIIQANELYIESMYSNGSRIQTNMNSKKVNVLGNGASYTKYTFIIEYTKTTD